MQTTADIPQEFAAPAQAALAWFNERENTRFELTGIADAPLHADADDFELGLVMCDGEICAREQIRIENTPAGFRFEQLDAPQAVIPPLLDPPPGLRRTWLSEQLEKFDFILLLFYRGRW